MTELSSTAVWGIRLLDGTQILTATFDGITYFEGRALCQVLEHANAANAIADSVQPGQRLTLDIREATSVTAGYGSRYRLGNPWRTFLTRQGVNRLILNSRVAGAERIRNWLADEVMPQIDDTGGYRSPAMAEGALTLATTYDQAVRELVEALTELQPAARAWTELAAAGDDFSVREAAHILNRNVGIDTGQQRLYAMLRAYRMLDRRNVPYARHSRHLRLRPRLVPDLRTGGTRNASYQVRVTYEGLNYLNRRLGGQQPLRLDQIDAVQ